MSSPCRAQGYVSMINQFSLQKPHSVQEGRLRGKKCTTVMSIQLLDSRKNSGIPYHFLWEGRIQNLPHVFVIFLPGYTTLRRLQIHTCSLTYVPGLKRCGWSSESMAVRDRNER